MRTSVRTLNFNFLLITFFLSKCARTVAYRFYYPIVTVDTPDSIRLQNKVGSYHNKILRIVAIIPTRLSPPVGIIKKYKVFSFSVLRDIWLSTISIAFGRMTNQAKPIVTCFKYLSNFLNSICGKQADDCLVVSDLYRQIWFDRRFLSFNNFAKTKKIC